jgi:hypothetical protein
MLHISKEIKEITIRKNLAVPTEPIFYLAYLTQLSLQLTIIVASLTL